MSSAADSSAPHGVPQQACQLETTPFDYIIVGSGAGGAPLACRLARAGMRVLVLEAGVDPGAPLPNDELDSDSQTEAENARALYHCPGLYEASSEPNAHPGTPDELQMSWDFRVRHYTDDAIQDADPKAHPDPYVPGQKSVFYPRCSSLGGCTSHHAMVTVYGTDREWRRIAELTGDESWMPARMREYFQRLERARYGSYRTFIGRLWERLLNWVKPARHAQSGRGSSGWLDVTLTDPKLAMNDEQLLRVIFNTALAEEVKGPRSVLRWLKRIVAGRFYRDLDPNDAATMRRDLEGVVFVPLAVSDGMRHGPREHMLQTQRDLLAREESGQLCIATGVFVKRVVFASDDGNIAPRAIGVEFACGRHLYQASPLHESESPSGEGTCFARREIILCGGAFNTPQLLMLSGIGEESQLKQYGIRGLGDETGEVVSDVINLPGVGKNLRDRYEVSVITEMKDEFKTLEGVLFDPNSTEDAALARWKQKRDGIYSTNGAAVGILRKSRQELSEPDLFFLGFPAAFRGYYPGWSKDLLQTSMGLGQAEPPKRNLWSWAILKAYSSNHGEVRLRSADPFQVPDINFRYFGDGGAQSGTTSDPERQDLEAVMSAVAYARRLNYRASRLPSDQRKAAEIQPGAATKNDSDQLRDWIKQNAWGHHACGTCRIGKDPWRAAAEQVADDGAVIDSKFRVHGVQGLRIVDASIFPEIPGYFIATPIYMVSEKAADTLLEDSALYPPALRQQEVAAVRRRREAAQSVSQPASTDDEGDELPRDTVGVALSGGGIRSATFSLGILQALAQKDRLRKVDFLSTISGGGYIGSFLGRLFTRPAIHGATDPCARVQDILRNSSSSPLRWLRTHANYLIGAGGSDFRQNLAVLWGNYFVIYSLLACLGLATFGILRLIGDLGAQSIRLPFESSVFARWVPPEVLSPWWWLPLAILFAGAVPASLAYWLAPKRGTRALLSFFPTVGWIALLCGLAVASILPGLTVPFLATAVVVLLTGVWLEVARPHLGYEDEKTGTTHIDSGIVLRNRLTRALGVVVYFFILVTVFVVLDTLARALSQGRLVSLLLAWVAILAPVIPFLRTLARWLTQGAKAIAGEQQRGSQKTRTIVAALVAFPLVGLFVVLIDGAVHALFEHGWWLGVGATVLAAVLTFNFRWAYDLLNYSSLQKNYAARLARTFLGATNPRRVGATAGESSIDVQLVDAEDDVDFHQYHPEKAGGPLHLIGVCVNETVDAASQRDIPDRKGLLMSVGPCGLSVGRRYHALWTDPPQPLPWHIRLRQRLNSDTSFGRAGSAVQSIPVPGKAFHVLKRKTDDLPIPVQSLDLGIWIAVSGAAFGTGLGRSTSLPLSLLCGLANIRLGFWWDTCLATSQRPGRFRKNLYRRIKSFPAWLVQMQSLLLSEFRGRFGGPGERFWYLSDGGHFDHTGVYELVRRRIPLMLAVDGGADPKLRFSTQADLARQVRIDFGAEIEFLERKTVANGSGDEPLAGWQAFEENGTSVPDLVKRWIDPDALGALDEVGQPGGKHAALARITYADEPQRTSWMILLKASLTGDESLDIEVYKKLHPDFPSETTADQFFDEAQWESYRKLGEITGLEVLK